MQILWNLAATGNTIKDSLYGRWRIYGLSFIYSTNSEPNTTYTEYILTALCGAEFSSKIQYVCHKGKERTLFYLHFKYLISKQKRKTETYHWLYLLLYA
jgi:hypothetical protein